MIKSLLKTILPKSVKRKLANLALSDYKKEMQFAVNSYAQEGEDIVLKRFLNDKNEGFFVDIGAHHPKRFSNTYYFYKKGWQGINIDAMPGSMDAFNKERPRDINLEMGISSKEEKITYHIFNEPALNTFSKKEAELKNGLQNYKILKKVDVNTFPLKDILRNHLPKNTKIDFMSIDVEGLDLEVLNSNDWGLYRPNLLLVEDLKKQSISEFQANSEIFKLLTLNNYSFVAKTFNTLFFKDNLV